MKKLTIAVTFSMMVLFSCQQKTTEQASSDSLEGDSTKEYYVAADPEVLEAEEQTGSESEAKAQGKDFDYTYEGLIGDKIKVRINFFKFKDSENARLVYLSAKKIINMEYLPSTTGKYELAEKVSGKITGLWQLDATGEQELTGTWSTPDKSKQMPIRLTMIKEPFDNFLPAEEIKTGFYELRELNDDEATKEEYPEVYVEELYVKNMAGNTLYFDLYIQGPPPGVHIGMINGIATKAGKTYVHKNGEGCEISMTFAGDSVSLGQKGADVDCGFGAFIGAYGTLKKVK